MKFLFLLAMGLFPALGFPATPTSSLDIGAVGAAGSTTLSNGVYTVAASGADIWFAEDEFRFVYSSWSGDGEITARVNSVVAADPWTKAGVMMRETLAANSRFAYTIVSGNAGTTLQYRQTQGGSVGPLGACNAAPRAPYWVRLRRAGNVFTGYISPNGTTWTQCGSSVTIPMSASLFVGLAVTAHRDGAIASASFSSVDVSATESALPPTTGTPTGSATLTWTPPTLNTDDSVLTSLAGYTIYWGRAQGSYTHSVTVHTPGIATYVIEQLASGMWYFAVSAMAASGFESAKSNEVYKLIQ